jgi:hypothetical protein
MDEGAAPPARQAARKEGLFDRVMRPSRIKGVWEKAGKIGTDSQTTQAICG